ncbi:MAG: hypothetical protein JW982_08445 [Spirochaetes bacterium]|nr:hypothetical protein [Spirochaetota bacterium]
MKFIYKKLKSEKECNLHMFPFLELIKYGENKYIYKGVETLFKENLLIKEIRKKKKNIFKIYIQFGVRSHLSLLYLGSIVFKLLFSFGLFLTIGVSLSFLLDPDWIANGVTDYNNLIDFNLAFFGIFFIIFFFGLILLNYLVSSNFILYDQINEIKKNTESKYINLFDYVSDCINKNYKYNSEYQKYLESEPIIFQSRDGGRIGLIHYSMAVLTTFINYHGIFIIPIIGNNLFVPKENIMEIKKSRYKTSIKYSDNQSIKKIILFTVINDGIISELKCINNL